MLKEPPKKMPDTPKGTTPKVTPKTSVPVPPAEVRINDAPPTLVPAPTTPRIEVAPQVVPSVNDPRPPF